MIKKYLHIFRVCGIMFLDRKSHKNKGVLIYLRTPFCVFGENVQKIES